MSSAGRSWRRLRRLRHGAMRRWPRRIWRRARRWRCAACWRSRRMNDLIEITKIAAPLLLGALGTWLAQRLKSRPQQQQDEAAAQRAAWELWRDQVADERARWAEDWGWAKTEIKDLRGQIAGLERRQGELLLKQAALEQRQEGMLAHIDDLYSAIGAEPDAGAAIKSRLKTQRPAAQRRQPRIRRGVSSIEREQLAT